jgi:hypothetical protein
MWKWICIECSFEKDDFDRSQTLCQCLAWRIEDEVKQWAEQHNEIYHPSPVTKNANKR